MSESAVSPADLIRRALVAYIRTGGAAQPDRALCQVLTHDGRQYVRLASRDGLAAIYRVHNDGQLRRMRRWPVELAFTSPDEFDPVKVMQQQQRETQGAARYVPVVAPVVDLD